MVYCPYCKEWFGSDETADHFIADHGFDKSRGIQGIKERLDAVGALIVVNEIDMFVEPHVVDEIEKQRQQKEKNNV